MDVGIGLPSTIPGAGRDQVLEWARRAEARGFSSLGTIDRVVYPNHEPLITLAAAAAVTERIRLATAILLAPVRANGALLAKQAATLDVLSGGRLVLGVAVGRREDDFRACGADFEARGRVLDEMLELWARIWDGEEGIGPQPPAGRPTVMLGGWANAAFTRAARHAAGWTGGNCTLEELADGTERLRAAWEPRDAKARRGRWCSRTTRSAMGRSRRSNVAWATTTGPKGPTPTRSWRGPRPTPRPCARTSARSPRRAATS